MKVKELRDKSKDELQSLLKERRLKLTQLSFDVSARQLKNYREIRQAKRDIARIMTLLK